MFGQPPRPFVTEGTDCPPEGGSTVPADDLRMRGCPGCHCTSLASARPATCLPVIHYRAPQRSWRAGTWPGMGASRCHLGCQPPAASSAYQCSPVQAEDGDSELGRLRCNFETPTYMLPTLPWLPSPSANLIPSVSSVAFSIESDLYPELASRS